MKLNKEENRQFYKKLFAISLPIGFQSLMFALVGASDAIMLGKIEQSALSAVSLACQIQFVFSLFYFTIASGTSIFAAQYWGKGDKVAVEKLLALAMKPMVIIAIIFCIGATFFPQFLMSLFSNNDVIIEKGAEYLSVVGVSYVLMGISQVYLCIMKNTNRALRCSIISSVSVVLNIGLNAIFIFGLLGFPAMEIRGAALATVIANLVSTAWAIIESTRKDSVRLRLGYFIHSDKPLLKDFIKYTMPVFGNHMVWGIGFTMYSVIMGHLGDDATAANSIANIAKNLTVCFCLGIANGGGIIVGNELGKGELEKAKIYGSKVTKISIISGIITGLVLIALTPLIISIANLSDGANEYLFGMLLMCSYYIAGKSVNATTIAGIFCGGGDSKFGFICDAITLWVVTVPLGFLTAFVFELPVLAVYFVITLDEIIKLPAVYINYKKYKWVKDLTIKSPKTVEEVEV